MKAGVTQAELDSLEGGPLADSISASEKAAIRYSREFAQGGKVGDETWRALDAARWTLGDRMLFHAMPDPMNGDDVRQLVGDNR